MRTHYDLHTHTTLSDGAAPAWEMIHAAEAMGLTHLGFADHLDIYENRYDWLEKRPSEDTDLLPPNYGVRLLFGAEVYARGETGDITADEPTCRLFDYIVCDMVWHKLGIPREDVEAATAHELAERVVQAHVNIAQNPWVDIIAHPFPYGRGVPKIIRPSDFSERSLMYIAEALADTGTAFEVMGNMWFWFPTIHPAEFRREYLAVVTFLARRGVTFSMSSDAHALGGVANIEWSKRLLDEAGVPDAQMVDPAPWVGRRFKR